MKYFNNILKSPIFALSVIVFLFMSTSAFTQGGVDSATREVDRPVREEAEERLLTPSPKEPKIEEEKPEQEIIEEGPVVFMKDINIEGAESVSVKSLSPIIKKYENREVGMSTLGVLCGEIEREYLRQGYIAVCFLPQQEVKDGRVTLRVIEARMGELVIEDQKYFNEDSLLAFWSTRPGEVLNYDKLSRNLQLYNKNPDREVSAVLYAGKTPLTTDVKLETETHFPIHPIFTIDNEGVVSTGKDRYGFGVRDNDFLFTGDVLLAGYTFGRDFSGIYAYHSVPITNFGTTVMYGYSRSRADPKKEFEQFGIKSIADNTSVFVYQDLYKKSKYLGEAFVGMDFKDKTTWTTDGTYSRDRLRVLRAGANLIHRFKEFTTYIRPEISQGLNIFGACRTSELTSREAGNVFTKFKLDVKQRIILPLEMQMVLNFSGQIASEKLTPQEEFLLGGINSVRGYPSGDFLADNAYQANVELLIPAYFIPETIKVPFLEDSLRNSITGLVFFDYGYGMKLGAASYEERDMSLASFGAGVRIKLFKKTYLRLEWGFPVGDNPVTETAASRFHFSLNYEI